MKKILIDGMTESMGGLEKFVYTLYGILKNNYQVDFITVDKEIPFKEEFMQNGCKIYKITPRHESVSRYKKDIENVFKKNEYDVFWFNKTTLSSVYSLKCAKKYKVRKVICHSHASQNLGSGATLIMHMINRKRALKFVDHKIACSDEAAEWFYGNKKDDAYIFANGVDIEKYLPSEAVRKKKCEELGLRDTFTIGHIGRFSEVKNHKFLISVFVELCKNIDAQLVLCGDGPLMDEVHRQVCEEGIEDRVTFTGVRNDIPDILQTMDVVVFPSLHEGLPFALVEAQAAGVPCVVSDTVSSEAGLTDIVNFVSLDAPIDEWVKTICKYKDYVKVSKKKQLAEQGFDLEEMRKKVFEIID